MKNSSKEQPRSEAIEYRFNKDGTTNPKYVDV